MNLYDTIYGHISLPEELKLIIDTVPFQRLRYIKQLGMVHYLYPGANHTRFEHSIGVAYLCYSLIKKIQLKQPELGITERDILLVSVAGLIHDIGHACFSHFFDDKLMENENIVPPNHKNEYLKIHEARSEYIFKKIIIDNKLNYSDDDIKLICSYVNPKIHNVNKMTEIKNKFRFEIVSNYISGFDCDKLDYLVRDSYYLGNRINLNVLSLIDNAVVINDSICYPKSMMLDVFSVYQSRFMFHKKYYGNNITRGIEYMIYDAMIVSSYFSNIANILDKDEFYNFTDNVLQNLLTSNEKCSEIIKKIYERKIYKSTGEINVSIDDEELLNNIVTKVNSFLNKNGIGHDFILDITRMNYGKGKYNPVKYINFYKSSKYGYKLVSDNDNLYKMSPKYCEEILFRIFVKSHCPENIIYNNLTHYNILFNDQILRGNISAETLSELIIINIDEYITLNRNVNKKYIEVLTQEISCFNKAKLNNI
jgi:HD superfamily phosphohydrolase